MSRSGRLRWRSRRVPSVRGDRPRHRRVRARRCRRGGRPRTRQTPRCRRRRRDPHSAGSAAAWLQHRAAGPEVLDDLPAVAGLERPDVLAVDRGHRRDVARAETLERAHVHGFSGRGPHHGVEQLVGAQQRARDVGADVDVVVGRARVGLEHVVEGGHRAQIRRASAPSPPPPGRWPAASTSRGPAERHAAQGSPPTAGRGTWPSRPRSRCAARRGRASSPDRAPPPGAWSDRPTRPTRGRGTRGRSAAPAGAPLLIGRCLRGSGRASPAWRSGRRDRRP